MPHDKNGHTLVAGDLVNIPARVREVYSTDGDAYCNVCLETVEPMFPTESKSTITLNAKQVELVGVPDIVAPPVAPAPTVDPSNPRGLEPLPVKELEEQKVE